MMQTRVVSLFVVFIAAQLAAAEGAVRAIWAVNDGEKVKRDDRQHAARARNSVWDGRRVRLFGARNEIVAVQVIVEADHRGITRLTLALPDLKAPSGDHIAYLSPALDPTDSVDRPIQIFVEHYMYVAMPSHAEWIYTRGSPAAPRDPTGWKPVQLVPEHARSDRGGLPIGVRPDENQAIWIEIYTGRDRPAGTYRGTIDVNADGKLHHLPIELELFDFALPDENSIHAMVYYESSQPERYHGRNLDAAYHRLAHRYRIELVHAYDEPRVQAAAGRFSGEDFTRAHGYQGPGEGVGNVIVPLSFYGPGDAFDDRPRAWRRADEWMTFLRARLPRALTFLYMPDEPRPPQYPRILTLAANVHSNSGPGRTLPVFVTSQYVEALDQAIDIWCAGPTGFDVARAARERARGRQFWVYNGGRPAGGAIVIDAPATDARAMMWAAFKHEVPVYFYWHAVHWRHNSQKQGERDQNVWADSITFDNRRQPNKPIDDQGYIHGDGVLLYPGEEKLHPDEDRGLPGPVATIQLANLRRGLQDHQYLTLARRLGLAAAVDAAVQAIVPRVFSEAGPSVSFPETGDPFEKMRLSLARAIVAAQSRPR
jgi:hypothetical protein